MELEITPLESLWLDLVENIPKTVSILSIRTTETDGIEEFMGKILQLRCSCLIFRSILQKHACATGVVC